ncbi:MAG: ArnT family glycosyltransferase [Gammaproteobacteria bacterium]
MDIAFRKFLDPNVCIEKVRGNFFRNSIPVLVFLMALLSLKRKFVHDEFEAIKTAWKLFSGGHIYVDFFQHHHPFLYYLLAPLFFAFGESTTVVLAARLIILLFAVGLFLVTYRIAALLFGKQTACVSVLLLFATTLFADKVVEVRPDVPQTFFGLVSIFLLFRYFASGHSHHLILSALALGIAFLFLQKILYLALCLHLLLTWRVMKRQIKPLALPIYTSVFLGTWAGYCLYLLLTNQFSQYFFLNFEFNLAKLEQHHFQSDELLKHATTRYNGIALSTLIFFPWTPKTQDQWQFALLAGSLLTIVALHRTQYAQYYLYVIPLLAILAARGWEHLAKRQAAIALIILVIFLLGSVSVYINELLNRQNAWQLEKIAYVLDQTSPNDYVYDGDIKFNLFRNDLDFFWFGVGSGKSLDKYKALKGYEYDVYALIDHFKPKLISDYAIGNLHHPAIRDHYLRSDRFDDLYVRIDDSASKPFSHGAAGSAQSHVSSVKPSR